MQKQPAGKKTKQQKTATQALYFVVFRHFTVLRYASSCFNVRGKITGTCKIMQESCVYLRACKDMNMEGRTRGTFTAY